MQTGGVLCAICCGKGIDLRQKIPHQRKRLPTPRAIMRFSAI
ncbi:hypothetical protein [Klebsiella pneumoniae IS46]|nr:hypothetical protein P244_3280 [Klebsiella pneumoniae HK787]AJC05379.1 hypothetical protein P243_3329 [Klebsiella pneumoniae subsp. pneumoniae 1158]EEW43674.1 hypothetical protein HMPREF0484_0280 [Klebsiella pneumoniae subsp. rhinoscleromatis ATCC 13884]EGF60070.1 hypothetical protein HMPREF9538_05529 [Klebsiella sp. MS 92-3]EOZ31715.1 hypothetical protein H246_2305 [Klebsiella pneumoniae VAKPC269]EOZ63017.1 hypothetical protein J050_2265 [Klebsiella pneumoniae 361_1301]EPN89497.1 hypothet